jgi:hypothetical protein
MRRERRITLRTAVALLTVCAGAWYSQISRAVLESAPADRSRDRLIAPDGYDAFCGGAPDCPPGHVPKRLRRHLRVPRHTPRKRCPVSAPGRSVSPYYAPAIGKGPVYAISLFSLARTGVLPFEYPPRPDLFPRSVWGGQVLKWIGEPRYVGPVLIRGRQINGPHRLGFGNGTVPFSEMQLPPGHGDPQVGGWRGWGGYARFRAPGCYGVQVDGTTFSEVIVFKAVVKSSSSKRLPNRRARADRTEVKPTSRSPARVSRSR